MGLFIFRAVSWALARSSSQQISIVMVFSFFGGTQSYRYFLDLLKNIIITA
jgi:hypothetical protein